MGRVGFLLAGVLLFGYLILELGPGEILSLFARIGWGMLIVCAVYGAYLLLRAANLYQCISERKGLTYRHIVGIYLSGEAVKNLTFGGAFFSEPFKAVLLRRSGLKTAGAFAAPLTESLVHVTVSAGTVLIAMICVLRFMDLGETLENVGRFTAPVLAVFLVLSLLTGWFRLHWVGNLTRAVARLPWLPLWLTPDVDAVYEVEELLFSIVGKEPKRCASIFVVAMLAQSVLVFELFLILSLLGLDFPLAYPLLIESVAKCTRLAFFFVPLQIGAAEGVFTVLFESCGLFAAAGLTFSLVRRVRSLVTSALGLLTGWTLMS